MAIARHQLAVIDNASPTTVEDVGHNYAHFINRDLSLLEFFRSVLEEGRDESIALLERLKFLAIFASNLDEFFMIRVSALKEKIRDNVDMSPDGYTRPELLEAIRRKVLELSSVHTDCLVNGVLPALANKGVVLESYEKLSADERSALDVYFDEQIFPVLTPQAVDPTHPFPYISGGSLNIGLYIKPKLSKRVARAFAKIGDEFFVRIKIPSFLPRFVPVGDPSDTRFVLIEEVIKANILKITPDADRSKCHLFRITRDGDIDIRESETEDLLETMVENLKERRFGDVVRLEVSRSMPAETI
jgi:polyphosphate kinase